MSAKSNFTQAFQELIGKTGADTEDNDFLSEDSQETDEPGTVEKKANFFNQPIRTAPVTTVGSTTTIAKGTLIVGEIRSDGDVNLHGDLKGMINSTGDLRIAGKVLGSLSGNDIDLKGASVQGIINATGNVIIDEASVIVGDINAASLQLTGKVKGNIVATGEATLNPNAILVGDITAKRISMNQAKVQGKIDVATDDHEIEIDLKNEMMF